MLSTTSLFLKNSRSELPLFLKWEWLPAQIPHLPFHRVQFCPLIRFAPWRLWTLMFHSVSLCHCELWKEFSSSKSTTCNFLHYFQISGAVDNAAFLIISLADSSTLRPLLPCWKHPNIQFVLHRNMSFHPDPPSNKIQCFSAAAYCVRNLGWWYRQVTQLLPSALSLEYSQLT